MGLGEMWSKTLVYFGIAEEEEWDEDGYITDEELHRVYAERPNVRRLPHRRGRRDDYDDWTDPEPAAARTSVLRPAPEPRRLRGVESVPSPGAVRVHLVLPRSFNERLQVGFDSNRLCCAAVSMPCRLGSKSPRGNPLSCSTITP